MQKHILPPVIGSAARSSRLPIPRRCKSFRTRIPRKTRTFSSSHSHTMPQISPPLSAIKLHPQGLPEAYSYWPGKISGLSRIPQNQPSEYAPLPALSRYLIHRRVLCDLLSVRCVKNRLLFTETRVFAPSNPFHQFNPESWLFQLQLT